MIRHEVFSDTVGIGHPERLKGGAAMERRALGATGLQVSVLGLGAAEIGFEHTPIEGVDRLLGTALDEGLNVIDTAECYLDSEDKIGRAVGRRRKEFYLFTKCGHASRPAGGGLAGRAWRKLRRIAGMEPQHWQPGVLEESIDRSLRRLRTDCVDLLQLHSCPEEILRRGEAIDVLERARRAGKTRCIGYSGDGQAALYAVETGRFDTLQTSVNIADQQAIDLTLPRARARRMGVIAKRPIANAVWRHACRPDNPYYHAYWKRLQELRYDFLANGGSPFEIALRFTLTNLGLHTAIVGTTKPEHWRQNVTWASAGPLESELFAAVRARWTETAHPDWAGQE
jgi:aryl-alcohol dehydrogenase-like predicted oxidoreductase